MFKLIILIMLQKKKKKKTTTTMITHNPNWPKPPDYSYKILQIGGKEVINNWIKKKMFSLISH